VYPTVIREPSVVCTSEQPKSFDAPPTILLHCMVPVSDSLTTYKSVDDE